MQMKGEQTNDPRHAALPWLQLRVLRHRLDGLPNPKISEYILAPAQQRVKGDGPVIL